MILKPEDALLAEAVFQRRSVRSFQLKKPDERAVAALRSEISYATSRDAAIHFQLFLNDPSPFEGFTAGYGMYRNARHYVACVVDTSYEDCMQRAGYWAEKVALRAVSKGLGTCFVSGTYKSDSVAAQLRVTWRIPFILLGIALVIYSMWHPRQHWSFPNKFPDEEEGKKGKQRGKEKK